MKTSEKFFEKVDFRLMRPSEMQTYGHICRLEGKIYSLNSFGTNNWVDKLLTKYKKQLKAISKNYKL